MPSTVAVTTWGDDRRIALLAMSGIRAHNPDLTALGMTLPAAATSEEEASDAMRTSRQDYATLMRNALSDIQELAYPSA